MPNRTRLTAAQYRERGIALPFRPAAGPAPLDYAPAMPPVVPTKRSPRPAPPAPGERVLANGEAQR